MPPEPLILAFKLDPDLHVIGSDSPIFALYDDGTCIFSHQQNPVANGVRRLGALDWLSSLQKTRDYFLHGYRSKKPIKRQDELTVDDMPILWKSPVGQYQSVQLSSSERNSLLDGVPRLTQASIYYDLSDPRICCHEPAYVLWSNTFGQEQHVFVRGNLASFDALCRLPWGFALAYRNLRDFSHIMSEPWLPEFIEVMVHPFEYSPYVPLEWPANWPDLKDQNTIERGQHKSFDQGAPLTFAETIRRKSAEESSAQPQGVLGGGSSDEGKEIAIEPPSDQKNLPEFDCNCYSIFLPTVHLDAFLALEKQRVVPLSERDWRQRAVSINGKKCSLNYRIPFPNDAMVERAKYSRHLERLVG